MSTARVPPASWLRRTAPHSVPVAEFLHCGAVFAWSEDRWIVAWGQPERAERPDAGRPSFFTPDFFLATPTPWTIYPHAAAVSPDGLAQQFGSTEVRRVWRPFDEAAFAEAFGRVQQAIVRQGLRKAVPAVFETSPGPLDEAERARALRAMANLPAGLMPYGFWDRAGGVLGASPEVLFEDDGVEIHTMAVAGTARAGTAPDEILEDPKERREHRIVLEEIEAQLAPLGMVTRGATRLWRIGILSHLRTDLRLAPEHPPQFADLVARLHPTPAVGTAPRDLWREWLPSLDGGPRGRFAAPFGLVLPDGTSRCLVAIRNVQWDGASTRCGAGCGLVAGSLLDRELAELRLKLAATRGNLGL